MSVPIAIPVYDDDIFKHLDVDLDQWWADSECLYQQDGELVAMFAPAINKIVMKLYGYRVIGVKPLERFVDIFNAKLIEGWNVWAPVIDAIVRKGDWNNIRDGGSEGFKAKLVHSEFPQTAINPTTEAYASNADDNVKNTRKTLSVIDVITKLYNPENPFRDPLTEVAKNTESCFSRLIY